MRTVALFALCALGLLVLTFTAVQAKGKNPASSWQFDAAHAKVDPHSSKYISTMLKSVVPPSLKKVLVMCQWGVAMATAKQGDPYYHVKLLKPTSGRLDAKIRIPAGTRPDKSGDAALTIYDPVSGREHDLWRAKFKNGKIVSCVNGMSFPSGADNEVDKDGATGGSNLGCVPLRRGTVTPEDLENGITQTMQMAIPQIGKGAPRWPAIHSLPRTAHGQTNNNVGPWRMVAGTWLRLSPNANINGLAPWERVIAQGLKDHGAIVRDYSRKLIIYAKDTINNQPGEKKFMDLNMGIRPGSGTCPNGDAMDTLFSASFPWDQLQVLVPPKHKAQKIQSRSPSAVKGGACWGICMKQCNKAVKKAIAKTKCPAKCTKICKKKGH